MGALEFCGSGVPGLLTLGPQASGSAVQRRRSEGFQTFRGLGLYGVGLGASESEMGAGAQDLKEICTQEVDTFRSKILTMLMLFWRT